MRSDVWLYLCSAQSKRMLCEEAGHYGNVQYVGYCSQHWAKKVGILFLSKKLSQFFSLHIIALLQQLIRNGNASSPRLARYQLLKNVCVLKNFNLVNCFHIKLSFKAQDGSYI